MINAAIVGLGWWGKTLVEAVQADSPDLHFVAGDADDSRRTSSVCGGAAVPLADTYEALLADPRSTRWCWRRRTRCTRAGGRGGRGRQAHLL